MSSKATREKLTARIIEKLNQGKIPWRKPWNDSGSALSWSSKKPYRGINALLLEPGEEYVTFNEIKRNKALLRKGSKGELVVFWKQLEITEEVENKEGEKETRKRTVPMLRYYYVFKVSDVEGLKRRRQPGETNNFTPITPAEKIVEGYKGKPPVTYNGSQASYHPLTDSIKMPKPELFENNDEYYSTLFHEYTHSTGHDMRLKRDLNGFFGTHNYSKEELIAEFGAAYLCQAAGISSERTTTNTTAYIQHWIEALKNNTDMVIQAASAANKAADYILGNPGGEK